MKPIRGFLAFCFLAIFSWPAYCQDVRKADQLGEEFQKQMPYSKEKPQSGETPGQSQPKEYITPPESHKLRASPEPKNYEYPFCYNPYTRLYEYCYQDDYDTFRLRYRSPELLFWWEHGRRCPPGYYFKPGWGCYRY